MTQYIDKSALVDEMERRRKKNARNKLNLAAAFEDNYLLSFIDTLEVKEVDLEKETKKWWKEYLHLNPENELWMDAYRSVVFAKHFFELGIKVAQKG